MARQRRAAGVKRSDVLGVTRDGSVRADTRAGSPSGGGFVTKDVPRSGSKPEKSPSSPPLAPSSRGGQGVRADVKPRAGATAEESQKTKLRRTIETEALTAADKLRHCLTDWAADRAGQRVGARRFQSYDGARMDGQPVGLAVLGVCPWGGRGPFILPRLVVADKHEGRPPSATTPHRLDPLPPPLLRCVCSLRKFRSSSCKTVVSGPACRRFGTVSWRVRSGARGRARPDDNSSRTLAAVGGQRHPASQVRAPRRSPLLFRL
jgi:hypothetical protein